MLLISLLAQLAQMYIATVLLSILKKITTPNLKHLFMSLSHTHKHNYLHLTSVYSVTHIETCSDELNAVFLSEFLQFQI